MALCKGVIPITHIADDKEYWQKLKEKLQEEVNEFLEAESPEEMADILEVLDAISNYKNFDKSEVEKIKEKKAQERGKFKDKIILDES
ncbi:MAG: nucleoside triphosphate pyrophosphohydrolase [bacterium]